jgi:hypothetical protein
MPDSSSDIFCMAELIIRKHFLFAFDWISNIPNRLEKELVLNQMQILNIRNPIKAKMESFQVFELLNSDKSLNSIMIEIKM